MQEGHRLPGLGSGRGDAGGIPTVAETLGAVICCALEAIVEVRCDQSVATTPTASKVQQVAMERAGSMLWRRVL